MKKINLKDVLESLSRSELRTIKGGSGTESCGNTCSSHYDCPTSCRECRVYPDGLHKCVVPGSRP